MAWNFCNGKSIGKQIADKIAIDILTGAILPQQRLPAAEDMSKITGASVRVVLSAYDELLKDGIVRQDGFLIISDDLTAAKKRRDAIAREAAVKFTKELSELGLSRPEQLTLFGETVVEQSKNSCSCANKNE